MNALILNGGTAEAPFPEIVRRAADRLEGEGASVVSFELTTMDIKPCRGCFSCWIKTPGVCYQRDAMDVIIPILAKADIAVWVTPIAFGGYGYHLKKALDRSIPVLLPFFMMIGGEVHHPMRYGKEPRLAAIGVLPEPDPESEDIFHKLVARNAINMHASPVSFVLYAKEDNGRWQDKLEGLVPPPSGRKEEGR